MFIKCGIDIITLQYLIIMILGLPGWVYTFGIIYIYQYFLLGTEWPMFGQSPRLPPHLQSEGPPRQIIFCHQYQSRNMLKSSLLLLLLHCLSDWKVNQTLEEELKGKSLQSTLSRLSIRNFKIPFLKKKYLWKQNFYLGYNLEY